MNCAEVTKIKARHAARACRLLCEFLEEHHLGRWSEKFSQILSMLDSQQIREAIDLDQIIPRAGMGSYGDFYVKPLESETESQAYDRFNFQSNAYSEAMT